MSAEHPLRHALVVNRLFMQAFLAADPPCLALGMVEEPHSPGLSGDTPILSHDARCFNTLPLR
jgi:hypothetical protein